MTAKEWREAVKEWDDRNSDKPVSEWEPFPGEMTHIRYPNGFVVATEAFIDEITREIKRELKKKITEAIK